MNPTDCTLGLDAYDATVESDPDQLVHVLATELNATVELPRTRGRWTQSWELHRGPGSPVAFVHYTEQRPDEPFVESKSHAEEVAAILRARYRHRIARIDSRLDFSDELYWYVIEPMLHEYARRTDTQLAPEGPGHVDPSKGGRTWYLGSKDAMRRLCVYEKGCELKLPTRAPIRVEARVRPPSKLKAHYASLTAEQVLMDNPFVRHLAERCRLDLGTVPRAKSDPRRPDLDRSLDTLARQYLATLRAAGERFDSYAAFVADLEERAELDRTTRAALKGASTWNSQSLNS